MSYINCNEQSLCRQPTIGCATLKHSVTTPLMQEFKSLWPCNYLLKHFIMKVMIFYNIWTVLDDDVFEAGMMDLL